jgi:chorismate synthase
MLRFLTAGESHGPALTVILEGMPSGLPIDFERLAIEMRRRQAGYGRGRRMAIETDTAEFLGGVRHGHTTGGPIAMQIRNRDWDNWQATMYVEAERPPDAPGARRAPVVRPRPGHADLAGALKYDHADIRDVLERASARETAARVAAGGVARQLLSALGIRIISHVRAIGGVHVPEDRVVSIDEAAAAEQSPVRCADEDIASRMMAAIDAAREAGDTLGGQVEVVVSGLPVGLGSHVQWDRKLDGRLAQAVMSIPAIKAVAIGDGVDGAARPGSRVHDEIVLTHTDRGRHLSRPTNRSGGLEGGITTGEDLRVTAFMKPIATLMQPLRSVDLTTLEEAPAAIERSDVCAVPAAGVIAEAMVALVLADAVLERFGGDSLSQVQRHVDQARATVAARTSRPA